MLFSQMWEESELKDIKKKVGDTHFEFQTTTNSTWQSSYDSEKRMDLILSVSNCKCSAEEQTDLMNLTDPTLLDTRRNPVSKYLVCD